MIETPNDGRKENLRQWGIADRREDRPSMWYPIKIDGIEVYPYKEDGTEGRWRVGEDMAKELLDAGKLELVKKGSIYNIYRIFDSGISVTPYDTLLLDDIGTTAKGATALKALDMSKIFDYSKPVELIKHFVMLATDEEDIILDFFSGSSTTAHSVMELNSECVSSKRKWIMVQLGEKTDEKSEAYKKGYHTICDIGKERIRRAGEKIQNGHHGSDIDVGFKVFRVGETNIKWNSFIDLGQLNLSQVETTPDLVDFMPGSNDIDIVYELMLRQRDVPLSESLEQVTDIGDRTGNRCIDKRINELTVIANDYYDHFAAALAYKMKMEAMKRQGARNDLTSRQNGTKYRTDVAIAEQTGESARNVQRYIRLTELIPDLLELVDKKRLNFTIAVDISYIPQDVQKWIYEYICDNGFIKPNQIAALRNYLGQGPVTQSLMISILNSHIPVKAPARKVTLNEKKLTKYFPKNYSSEDMEKVIESLLEKWKQEQEVK